MPVGLIGGLAVFAVMFVVVAIFIARRFLGFSRGRSGTGHYTYNKVYEPGRETHEDDDGLGGDLDQEEDDDDVALIGSSNDFEYLPEDDV